VRACVRATDDALSSMIEMKRPIRLRPFDYGSIWSPMTIQGRMTGSQ